MWSFFKQGHNIPHIPAGEMGDEDGVTGPPDASLERLLHAWHPVKPQGRQLDERPGLRASVEAAPRSTASRCKTLLLCPPPEHEAVVDGLKDAWPLDDKQHRIAAAWPSEVGELDRLLSELAPQVLLIDAGVCLRAGKNQMRHLRHAFPAVDWIVGWHDESLRCPVDLLIYIKARGCVAWNAETTELVRAIRTVLAGELWFSRSVMQLIYLSLLSELHIGSGDSVEPSLEAAAGLSLSTREVQVLALTREGLTNKQIAERLDISINTVKKHLANSFEKRGLRSRRQILK